VDNYFEIGVITAPTGLKGWVRVFPLTDEPARFAFLSTVHVDMVRGGDAISRKMDIEAHRFQKNLVYLKFRGIEDTNAAEALRNAKIRIPPEMALPLEDDQYFHRDLLDMEVFDMQNNKLGEIIKIIQTGANDVYIIRKADKSELLLPAIKQCVKQVDVSAKRMVVELLPGL